METLTFGKANIPTDVANKSDIPNDTYITQITKNTITTEYVNALNIIHYMHDKYCYERLQMSLHDKNVKRWCTLGFLPISTWSLSRRLTLIFP